MKENDLEKILDNLIIDGLIKEAEQDNADFEAAMRNMSEEEFEELIYEPDFILESNICDSRIFDSYMICSDDEDSDYMGIFEKPQVSEPSVSKKSKWQVFRPWIISAVAAAAVVLIILIPSINAMNDKLCDSALYASTEYITSSRSASEINGLSDDQLRSILPKLEGRYMNIVDFDGEVIYYSDDLQEAGWDLTLAYLRLHKKGDAEKVLKVLATQYKGTPFGDHCQKILEQL